MRRKHLPYNPYFLIPFAIWLVVGGILMMVYDQETLFRAINTHSSIFCDLAMYDITYLGRVEVILPVLFILLLMKPFCNWWYFFTAVCCNIIPLLLQQFLKVYFYRPRPLYYFFHTGWLHFQPWWDQLFYKSFPSGHTEGAFSFFCFLSLLLPRKWQRLGLVFFILAFLTGYSRVYLAAHFFEDVYLGSIVGCITTLIIYHFMKPIRRMTLKVNVTFKEKNIE